VSFASEPERDDGSLPPVNVVIPDDARELDRDVLAYRRELRALRRRQRRRRLLGPLGGPGGGPAAIVPLIALFLAIALVGGALLSVLTISPAEQDSALTPSTSASASASPSATSLTTLPAGTVQLDGKTSESRRSLASSAVALVPSDCGCGQALARLTGQARAAGARLYFVGVGVPSAELTGEYGGGYAIPADDADRVLADAYHPAGLTVLLVFSDATATVQRNLTGDFELGLTRGELDAPGAQAESAPSARAHPTAGPKAG
jgi:hypothetical protein